MKTDLKKLTDEVGKLMIAMAGQNEDDVRLSAEIIDTYGMVLREKRPFGDPVARSAKEVSLASMMAAEAMSIRRRCAEGSPEREAWSRLLGVVEEVLELHLAVLLAAEVRETDGKAVA